MDPTEETTDTEIEEPQEIEEAQEIEETQEIATRKKRGRPSGSKNKAPDVYAALLDRMTQMEETFKNRESSTGGTPETPVRMKRIRQPKQPKVQIEAPEKTPTELLMDSLHQTGEARRRRQMEFYATFLP
jgi:hypothetical protein